MNSDVAKAFLIKRFENLVEEGIGLDAATWIALKELSNIQRDQRAYNGGKK